MYTRRHEAGERVAMRHWLREQGINPVMGSEPNHTELLMKQVFYAPGGGVDKMDELIADGRARIDRAEENEVNPA